MERYIIGLDAGGTRTRGILVDESMRRLARAQAGPGNPLSAGKVVASRSIRRVVRNLLESAGKSPADVEAAGLGAAGAGRERERVYLEGVLRRVLPSSRIVVDSDGLIALLGATSGGAGMLIIAGTGSLILAVDRRGRRKRGGGWGPLFGDEGSGATMGRHAVCAVLRSEDGRDPPTRLRQAVLAHFEVSDVSGLISQLYEHPPAPRDYGALWPEVAKLAEAGDGAARTIALRGAAELAETARAVAAGLDFGPKIPLVFSGGVLSVDSLLRRSLLGRLRRSLPVRLVEPRESPEWGAVHLARSRARR